jgi:hypothetical protein
MKSGRFVVVTSAAGGMGLVIMDGFLSNGDKPLAGDSNHDAPAGVVVTGDAGDALISVTGEYPMKMIVFGSRRR